MSTVEIKQQLPQYIEEGEDKFIKMFYEMAKAYTVQQNRDKMIVDGEKDVADGRVYDLEEARKILDNWQE